MASALDRLNKLKKQANTINKNKLDYKELKSELENKIGELNGKEIY